MQRLLMGLLLVSFVSCKKDIKPVLTHDEIQGKWLVKEAYRNEKPTQTLSNAYYEFKDSLLSTNIFGNDFPVPFKIENMEIVQHLPNEIRYQVSKNPDQTLGLTMNINGISFRMLLRKE
ncbi:MAG: hypothetical protein IT267_04950 [Saprospiraceae bacterium]|nr:hypothetical protein [Saprospiraceae bacterium]